MSGTDGAPVPPLSQSQIEDEADDQRGEPQRHDGRETLHRRVEEEAEAVEDEHPAHDEQADADAGVLGLRGELGLRERDLGADEARRLLGQALHELSDRRLLLLGRDAPVDPVAHLSAFPQVTPPLNRHPGRRATSRGPVPDVEGEPRDVVGEMQKTPARVPGEGLFGGSDRRRSGDLSIFSRTLYQLSYRAMGEEPGRPMPTGLFASRDPDGT